MRQNKTNIVLAKSDFDLISAYLKGVKTNNSFDKENAEELTSEIKRATIVSNDVFPKDVVRINSTVLLKDETAGKIFELTVVIPEKADIKQKKISFLAPVGTALIGFKEGEKVRWNVPAGKRKFMILKVIN